MKKLNKNDSKKTSGGGTESEETTVSFALSLLFARYMNGDETARQQVIANVKSLGRVPQFNKILKDFGASDSLLIK